VSDPRVKLTLNNPKPTLHIDLCGLLDHRRWSIALWRFIRPRTHPPHALQHRLPNMWSQNGGSPSQSREGVSHVPLRVVHGQVTEHSASVQVSPVLHRAGLDHNLGVKGSKRGVRRGGTGILSTPRMLSPLRGPAMGGGVRAPGRACGYVPAFESWSREVKMGSDRQPIPTQANTWGGLQISRVFRVAGGFSPCMSLCLAQVPSQSHCRAVSEQHLPHPDRMC
jgi:hypothetical protein